MATKLDRDRSTGGEKGLLALLDAELLVPALLHELKQPLTGADAALALLERALPGLEGREEWHLLRRQLARIGEVLGGYDELFYSGSPREEPFDLVPVVARAVELLAHRIRPMGGRFSLTLGDGPVHGLGSPAALVHAALNVLGNAADAVEAGGREGRIAVRLLATDGGAEVRISDEGPGLSEAARERLFEPRFSTKPPGAGTGLGLHLSRTLMNRFGGGLRLVAPDEPGRLPWATTEFSISVALQPEGRRP